MKTLTLILSLLFSMSALSYGEVENKHIEDLLDTLEVNKFVAGVTKLKKYKSLERIDEVDYELRRYFRHIKLWYYFDEENYKDQLKEKIADNFTIYQIKWIKRSFKRHIF